MKTSGAAAAPGAATTPAQMRVGAPVATTSASGTSTKSRPRNPEAHQSRKGNSWHFGHKVHAGVHLGTDLVHTVEVTAISVFDVSKAHRPLRPDDRVYYADAGHTGIGRRPKIAGNPALSSVE